MGDNTLIYDALVDGAMEGLTGAALADFALRRHPQARPSALIEAALMAFSDPEMRDRNIIDTLAALALTLRMQQFHRQDASPRDTWPAPFGRRSDRSRG